VTAICPTRNRPEWMKNLLTCFESQTYLNAELLIVADGIDVQCKISEALPVDEPRRHRVRYIYLNNRMTIGGKRNFACSRAHGEIIVHFDDDDWSGPERIASQVATLSSQKCWVSGFNVMLFEDELGFRYRYKGRRWFVCGTSLAYRKEWQQRHPFPSQDVQEDADFAWRAYESGMLHSADAGELMRASIHTGNTSPRNLKLTDMYQPL
jgi:glycosyltransferase involved in cell wall biosynthesis